MQYSGCSLSDSQQQLPLAPNYSPDFTEIDKSLDTDVGVTASEKLLNKYIPT